MKKLLLAVAFATALAGCEPAPVREPGERVVVQPAPRATDDGGPGLCMPCVGPHLSLTGGGIKFFSMGPGIGF